MAKAEMLFACHVVFSRRFIAAFPSVEGVGQTFPPAISIPLSLICIYKQNKEAVLRSVHLNALKKNEQPYFDNERRPCAGYSGGAGEQSLRRRRCSNVPVSDSGLKNGRHAFEVGTSYGQHDPFSDVHGVIGRPG